jgi:hypothetical protein
MNAAVASIAKVAELQRLGGRPGQSCLSGLTRRVRGLRNTFAPSVSPTAGRGIETGSQSPQAPGGPSDDS